MPVSSEYLRERLLKSKMVGMKHACLYRTIGNFSKQYETRKRVRLINRACEAAVRARSSQASIRLLDLGCGDGFYSFNLYLNAPGRNLSIEGIDISEIDIEYARRFADFMAIPGDAIHFTLYDGARLPFEDAAFDIVLLSEVLEHLPRPDETMREIRRVLKPGGTAIVSTPNLFNPLVSAARKAKGLFGYRSLEVVDAEADGHHDYPGHISVMDLGQLKKLAAACGFTVTAVNRGALFWGAPFFDDRPVLFALVILLDRVLDLVPFASSCCENMTLVLRRGQA